jgi:signal transduction histidine kinase
MARLEAKSALDEERARISRDMHDEVGAQLAQLAILQSMFAREHQLPAEARESMQQLAQTTRKAVASLDEVVWAVNPRNDTLPSLAAYLEQCATGYLEPVDIACRLDAPLEWPEIEVRAQVRHNLVLAFREALQNILKHSGATEVMLTLRLESTHFLIVLADNGRGLPSECGGAGKDGLANMAARLTAVGGTCAVQPRPIGGTEVKMRVPLPAEAITARGKFSAS